MRKECIGHKVGVMYDTASRSILPRQFGLPGYTPIPFRNPPVDACKPETSDNRGGGKRNSFAENVNFTV